MLRFHFCDSLSPFTCRRKVMVDMNDLPVWKQSRWLYHPLTRMKTRTFPTPKWTTIKRSLNRKEIRGGISNFIPPPKKKIISMEVKSIKTYFYVCLLKWKTWESSTNNKLWWFQNDSTDFSRLPCFPLCASETAAASEAQTKTNLFWSWKSLLPRQNKLIKIVSLISFRGWMRKMFDGKRIADRHCRKVEGEIGD